MSTIAGRLAPALFSVARAPNRDNHRIDTSAETAPSNSRPAPSAAPCAGVAAWVVPEQNPGGTVYGALIVAALLAAEGGRHETYAGTVAAAVIATALSWLAHSYAVVLGDRLEGGPRIGGLELVRALMRERALLRGTVIPMVVLLVFWAAGRSQSAGVTAAIWSVIIALVLYEMIAAVRSKATPREFALDVCVGLTLGIGILALKIVLH